MLCVLTRFLALALKILSRGGLEINECMYNALFSHVYRPPTGHFQCNDNKGGKKNTNHTNKQTLFLPCSLPFLDLLLCFN